MVFDKRRETKESIEMLLWAASVGMRILDKTVQFDKGRGRQRRIDMLITTTDETLISLAGWAKCSWATEEDRDKVRAFIKEWLERRKCLTRQGGIHGSSQ